MNKIRDINFIVNRDDERRQELEHTRNQIRVATEQIIHMRRQKVLYRIVLQREMGLDVRADERAEVEKSWKDRSMEKNYLKSELITLVDILKDVHPKFHYDPDCLPTHLSSARDVILTKDQMEGFVKIYAEYNACSGQNSELPETIKSYMEKKTNYEKQLVQNQVMTEEIKAIKLKLEDLQLKAKEDKKFMKFLITFKLHEQEPNENCPQKLNLQIPRPEVDMCHQADDSLRYKTMWEGNVREREQTRSHIEALASRVELAMARVLNAERMCLVNLSNCQRLELLPADRDFLRRKSSVEVVNERSDRKQQFWEKKSELQVLQNENNYLSTFIADKIIQNERDFALLHSSLSETSVKYRDMIAALAVQVQEAELVAEARRIEEEAAKEKAASKGKKKK